MSSILTRRVRNLLRNTAPDLTVSLTRLKQFLVLESQGVSFLRRGGVSCVDRSPFDFFFATA